MISVDTIKNTHDLIKNHIIKTPLIRSNYDDKVYFKLENLQKTGSFKERGALTALMRLTKSESEAGVVVASAGNHSQAIAYHAKRLGITCKVYMPLNTPSVKIINTKGHGAEVIIKGDTVIDCVELAKKCNMTFIHPFDSDNIICGQGTLGIELLEQLDEIDCIVVPVGGGGLAAGIISYIKQTKPNIKIISAESDSCPSMSYALKCGNPCHVNAFPSLADGIAVRKVGDIPFNIIKDHIDDHIVVSDKQIAQAVVTILDRDKVLVEGSGAVAFAAVQQNLSPIFDSVQKIVCICSGGNIDGSVLCKIIERGLKASGRLVRLCVMMKDNSGNLADILNIIGSHDANVRNIIHEKTFQNNDTPLEIVRTYIEIETTSFDQIDNVIESLKNSDTVLGITI